MQRAAPVEDATRAPAPRRPGAASPCLRAEAPCSGPRAPCSGRHPSNRCARRRTLAFLGLHLALVVLAPPRLAWAVNDAAEVMALDAVREEDGLYLNYAVELGLPRAVEDALLKAVPLYFVAEVQVFRERWYWRDRRVADAVRVWRIVYQPLTSSYRVTFGGLSQSYASRDEALIAISRGSRWKIAEAGQVESGASHYLEFTYKLDPNLLPRPLQIGVGGQPDWQVSVRRTLRLN